jgi:hypothetical protein
MYLSSGIDQRSPFELWKEICQEIRIDISLLQFNLDVPESKREVIRCAALDMAGEEVVCDQANHLRLQVTRDRKYRKYKIETI